MEMFRKSQPLRHADVADQLVIPAMEFDGAINCDECHFARFSAPCALLQNPVRFTDCRFDFLDLYATYFLKGLIIERCVVADRVTFQSGGHNNDAPITICNTRFESFVDFEDCWFTGPFSLHNVTFNNGTNLLGNQNTPMAVSFDVAPEFVDVIGDLAMNTYNREESTDR